MRRKGHLGIAQAAEIDDALDSGAFGRSAKIAGGRHVALGKIGTCSEAGPGRATATPGMASASYSG